MVRIILDHSGHFGTVESSVSYGYKHREGMVVISGKFHDYDPIDRGRYLDGSGELKIDDTSFLRALARARSGEQTVLG